MNAQNGIRYSAGAVTFLVGLVIVTPLCGMLFQCGCGWPWSGLDTGCNFYQAAARYRCPWCASMTAGITATGTALAAAVLAASSEMWSLNTEGLVNRVAIRVLLGICVFVGIAALAAVIAAHWQNYPLGIGRYI